LADINITIVNNTKLKLQ